MKKIQIILYALIASCFLLDAQVEDQMLPSEIKQLTAVTEPATLYKGFFRAGLIYSHFSAKKIFDPDGNRLFLEGNALAHTRALNLSLSYGITRRIQVNLLVPYAMDMMQQSAIYDDPLMGTKQVLTWDQKGNGLGDVSLGVYGQIIRENQTLPSLTARLTYTHPTGRKEPSNIEDNFNYDLPTGSGEPVISVDLQLRKVLYPYSFVFTGSYNLKLGGEKIFEPGGESYPFTMGNSFMLQGGFNFLLNDWLSMGNELAYLNVGKTEIDGLAQDDAGYNISYQPYFHFQIKQLRLIQSMYIALKGKNYTASPSYILAVQYIF